MLGPAPPQEAVWLTPLTESLAGHYRMLGSGKSNPEVEFPSVATPKRQPRSNACCDASAFVWAVGVKCTRHAGGQPSLRAASRNKRK
jgi:hypothetical protein